MKNWKIFSNKYFYITIVIVILFFNFVLKRDVSWFTRLWQWASKQNVKLWKEYIRKSSVDDTSIGLVLAGVKLGKWDYTKKYYLDTAVDTLQEAQNLININVIDLVDDSPNKQQALELHIKQMDSANTKLQDIWATLLSMSDEKKSEYVACESEKITADTMFFQGLSQNEKDEVREWLDTSLEKWPCYITNRILANAYYNVYDKVNYYTSLLNSKQQLVETNQDLILENYQLFRDNYLDKLLDLRERLGQYEVSWQTE